MIYKINNDELFNLSSSIGENAYLPELSKNFISRLGIKMVSEDGNNILQGFGAFDICKEDDGEITYKIIKIYISPEFVNTDYKDIILEHLCKYAKDEAFGHITLTNKKPLDITEITDENSISNIIEFLTEFDELAGNHPKKNRNSIGLKAYIIYDENNYPISMLLEDIFTTAKGKFIRIMNVFTIEEYRNQHLANCLLEKAIKDFKNGDFNNILISCVGPNKELMGSILQKFNFTLDSENKGKINYYL